MSSNEKTEPNVPFSGLPTKAAMKDQPKNVHTGNHQQNQLSSTPNNKGQPVPQKKQKKKPRKGKPQTNTTPATPYKPQQQQQEQNPPQQQQKPKKQSNMLPDSIPKTNQTESIFEEQNTNVPPKGKKQQNLTDNNANFNANGKPFLTSERKKLPKQGNSPSITSEPVASFPASENLVPLDLSEQEDITPQSQNSMHGNSTSHMLPTTNSLLPDASTPKENAYAYSQEQETQTPEAHSPQQDQKNKSFDDSQKNLQKTKKAHLSSKSSNNAVSMPQGKKKAHQKLPLKPPIALMNAARCVKWNDQVYQTLLNKQLHVFTPFVNWLNRVKLYKDLDQASPPIKAQIVEIVEQAYACKVVNKIDWQFQTIGGVLYLRSGQMINIPLHVKEEIRLPFMNPSTKLVKEALAIAEEAKRLNESHRKKDASLVEQNNDVPEETNFSKERNLDPDTGYTSRENGELPSTSDGVKEFNLSETESFSREALMDLQNTPDVQRVGTPEPLSHSINSEPEGSLNMKIPLPSTNTSQAYVAPVDPINTNNYQYTAAMKLPESQKPETKTMNKSKPPVFESNRKRSMEDNTSELSKSAKKKKARLEKFKIPQASVSPSPTPNNRALPFYKEDYGNLNKISSKAAFYDKNAPLVGTNMNLEKSFLRLTSEARPENIRPVQVLLHSYEHVLSKYKSGEATYQYFCDQFKSIRQDLKVQLIETPFTIQVYSKHAEIALKNGDLGEFNQCQTSLVSLFGKHLGMVHSSLYIQHCCFLILYRVMMKDFNSVLKLKCMALMHKQERQELLEEGQPVDEKEHCLDIDLSNLAIKVSLKINDCIMANDYHGFFKLYKIVCKHDSSMNRDLPSQPSEISLVQLFVEQCLLQNMRLKSFAYMARSCHTLLLGYLLEYLAFTDVEQLLQFFHKLNILHSVKLQQNPDGSDNSVINCKECALSVWTTFDKSKSIDIKGQL